MSSDSTSTDDRAGADDRGPEDAVDSLDQSLEEIMKEVQQADGPAVPDAMAAAPYAVETEHPMPAETVTAELALPIPAEALRPLQEERDEPTAAPQPSESAPTSADGGAEPMPVAAEATATAIYAMDVSARGDEQALGGSDASFGDGDAVSRSGDSDAGSRSGEQETAAARSTDSDAAIELSIDEVEAADDEVEAEAVVESILATARTSSHDAERSLGAAPISDEEALPSDEMLLASIVLPASTPATPPATRDRVTPSAGFEVGDDDRTMISALPPEVEPPPVRLPAPALASPEKVRRVTPTWPGTETVKPGPQQFGRLPRPPSRGWFQTARQVASHRVNASVAQLAIVVVSATAFGAAAVRVLGPVAPAIAGAEAITIPERPTQPHFESLPPRPPEIAPLPSPVAETVEPAPVPEVEKPKPRPVRRRVARAAPPPAPAADATADHSGEAAPADPGSRPAAPARKAAATKARTRHVAQQAGTWVDPFGD
jgi:hypothetical protein